MSQNDISNEQYNSLNELEKLYAFMKKYRNESGRISGKNLPWTHALVYEPYGSYNIPDDSYSKFKKLYEDAIVAGYESYIVEKHKEYGPIVIDFHFSHSKHDNKRYYTNNTILNIIRLYNKIIKKYLNVKTECMDAYVCEKKEPSLRRNEYHDGIHIVYPYICTIPSLQMLMRKEFVEEAEKIKIFKEMPLINNLDSVFDKDVIYNVRWMMYGSTKNATSHPYYLTHIFTVDDMRICEKIISDEHLKSRSFVRHCIDVLSCRRFLNENGITP
jgi:hypothetical protein